MAECVGKSVELVGGVGGAWAKVGWLVPPPILGLSSSVGGGGGVVPL